MEATRARDLRRKLGGIALVVAPGLIFLADLIQPNVDWDDRAAVLDTVAANMGRWNIAGALWYVGFLLMIPAVIAAARYFRRQRPGMSLIATILAPIPPVLITGFVMFGMTDEAFADPAADREQMIALSERIDEVTLMPMIFGLMIVGMVGMLFLSIGLWRSKVVPIWAPVAIVVGFVLAFFGPQDQAAVSAIANLILWLGFGAVGLKILSEAREGAPPPVEAAA